MGEMQQDQLQRLLRDQRSATVASGIPIPLRNCSRSRRNDCDSTAIDWSAWSPVPAAKAARIVQFLRPWKSQRMRMPSREGHGHSHGLNPSVSGLDLSYSALHKHWLWNPSLLYYTQAHIQAQAAASGGQFLPYAGGYLPHAMAAAAASSTSTLGGFTKSESSIDLSTPGAAGDALSDCDSGKSSPAALSLTASHGGNANRGLCCSIKRSHAIYLIFL